MNPQGPPGSARFDELLESAPAEEIMIIVVVAIIFSTLLLIAITFLVTSTIRSVRIASINARLIEKLVREGVPVERIERLVRANRRGNLLSAFTWVGQKYRIGQSRWKKAPGRVAPPPGKADHLAS
jgi:type II secretory pathway component PulJ